MSIKSKLAKARRNSKYRLSIIVILIVILGVLFYFIKNGTMKIIFGSLIALLLGAGAMEVTGKDYDVQKLIKTRSFSESQVEKTQNGFWKIGDDCTTNTLNCSDFEFQEDAQDFFESCGGKSNNINRLDGNDKDGKACESLPSKASI